MAAQPIETEASALQSETPIFEEINASLGGHYPYPTRTHASFMKERKQEAWLEWALREREVPEQPTKAKKRTPKVRAK